MIIDENKIKKQSNAISGGINMVKFKPAKSPHQKAGAIIRWIIGFVFIGSLIFGTIYALYSLLSEGQKFIEVKSQQPQQQQVEFIQVTFKPKAVQQSTPQAVPAQQK